MTQNILVSQGQFMLDNWLFSVLGETSIDGLQRNIDLFHRSTWSTRLMEFIEGAQRLRGGAKALDIWRMETKIEAIRRWNCGYFCVKQAWPINRLHQTYGSFTGKTAEQERGW